jgi:hypothetical protein
VPDDEPGVGVALATGPWREGSPNGPAADHRRPAREGATVEPQAGPEVNGLRATVAPAIKRVKVGEPVPVCYAVRNVSKEEQTLWHSGFWPNHLILAKDADGKDVPLTALGKRCRDAFSPGGPRGKNVPVRVAAGGEDAAYERYDLTRLFDLSRPGRYTVQYVYEERQAGGWQGRLPSNEAAFEVVAARGDGQKVVEKDGVTFDIDAHATRRRCSSTSTESPRP